MDTYIPQMSYEKRKEIFENLKIGDFVYYVSRYGWSNKQHTVTKFTVKNITPKGRARLSDGKLLDSLPGNYYVDGSFFQHVKYKIYLMNDFMRLAYTLDRKRNDILDNLDESDVVNLVKLFREKLKENFYD